MDTHVPALKKRRLDRGLLAAAAVVAMATGTLAIAGNAHAEAGRRICEYSFKVTPTGYLDPLMKISLGVDYKKDGACPTLRSDKLVNTGFVDYDQILPNPVPKQASEDWGRTHQTALTWLGPDPTTNMLDDCLYAFFWQDPTTPNAKNPSYLNLGDYENYT
jgi:hypothetical protein